jgi:hypothetical protein
MPLGSFQNLGFCRPNQTGKRNELPIRLVSPILKLPLSERISSGEDLAEIETRCTFTYMGRLSWEGAGSSEGDALPYPLRLPGLSYSPPPASP